MTGATDLGIVIVNWNVRELLAGCLDSVYLDLAQSARTLRGRGVRGRQWLHRRFSRYAARPVSPPRSCIAAENRGMGAGNNLGLRALVERCQPFALLVLNPDTVVRPGALRSLVAFLRGQPRAGVAAPKLLYPNGRLQHAGFRFPGWPRRCSTCIHRPAAWRA